MRRQPPLFGLRTAVTLALFAIAGFPLIFSVDARQLYVSADGAISVDPDYFNLFFSVDTSTQCRTTGYYTADTTGTGTATGTITLTEGGTSSRSGACTGTNAAVSFPASCVMTPTTLTCGSKTFTSSVDSWWQLSGTVYKGCTSTAGEVRVNNTHMTLDVFTNGCVLQQIPYVARGGLVWMMGIPAQDAACEAKQPTDPPATPRPPGPPPTPSPPTRTGALFSATATQLCLQDSSNVCFYTDCSAAGGGAATPSSSASTVIGIAAGVAIVAILGIAAGVFLMRRPSRPAARVTTNDMTSAMLAPQTSPYGQQQQQQYPAAQKGADDLLLL